MPAKDATIGWSGEHQVTCRRLGHPELGARRSHSGAGRRYAFWPRACLEQLQCVAGGVATSTGHPRRRGCSVELCLTYCTCCQESRHPHAVLGRALGFGLGASQLGACAFEFFRTRSSQ
jgi:hypothetical protein